MPTTSRGRFTIQLTIASFAVFALFLGQAPVARTQVPPQPATNVRVLSTVLPGQKPVIQPSDISYLGMFYVPPTVNGRSTRYELGLAFRRVGGVKHLFAGSNNVFEMSVPVEKSAAPYNTAALAHDWGGISGSWQTGATRGIYWDEIDKRLYQVMGDYYSPAPADKRVVYYATIDDAAGTKVVSGPWAVTNLTYKMVMGGVVGIPDWFATQYLGGKRIALGFGGAYSTMGQNGPGSAGPAMTAIAPPPPSTPQFSALADTPLIAHWWNGNQYQAPMRWARTPDMNLKPSYKPSAMWLDGGIWNTLNGVGYWTWVDLFEAAGVWIDLPTKHGMLFAPALATGDVWYESSDTRYTGLKHYWTMYDPMKFVPVATGTFDKTKAAAVTPAWHQDVQYPFNRYPLCPWKVGDPTDINHVCGGTPYYQVPKGMAFDPVESRLYILMAHPGSPWYYAGGYDDMVVYVYQVS